MVSMLRSFLSIHLLYFVFFDITSNSGARLGILYFPAHLFRHSFSTHLFRHIIFQHIIVCTSHLKQHVHQFVAHTAGGIGH